ncbi:MAG: NDP-sugar synthase [Pseudomonadota bacterium]
MKAVILAAGFGNRLKPITENLPKPLVPVINEKLITYPLMFLYKNGIRDIGINLYHLGDQIKTYLTKHFNSMFNFYFSEETELLGTGGGIQGFKNFIDDENFIVINSDTLIDFNFLDCLHLHIKNNSIATMVLRKNPSSEGYGDFSVNKYGKIVHMLGNGKLFFRDPYMYTGVQILNRNVFDYLPEGKPSCIINDFYIPAFEEGEFISGYKYNGFWADIGTIDRYFDTSIFFLKKRYGNQIIVGPSTYVSESSKIIPPVIIAENCKIKKNCEIGPYVIIGENCKIEKGSKISESIIFENVIVAQKSNLKKVILNKWNQIDVTR